MKMMSGNTNYTIGELAKKLGITYRSVYRYIDTFKESGFVVDKLRKNVYKLGKMPKGLVEMDKLIYFTEEEAYIVNSLINRLDTTNALKADLHRKLTAVFQCTSIADYFEDKNCAANIEMLGQAIREKKKVILKNYESGNSRRIADRVIEPYEFTTNYIDIWGFDIEKGENKVFKISRIDWVCILDDEWTKEAMHQKAKTDCFRMSGNENYHVKLELSIKAKSLLTEEYPLSEKHITKKSGRWIFEANVCRLEGVGRFVIGLADQIKVLEGQELKDYIANFVKSHL
jgi:predicted DNA-binding transcriptional regulator YafY